MATSMALVPTLPAGASKPGLCSLNKAEQKVELKSTGAITKAIESGNWTAAKKALLASFGQSFQAEQLAVSALSGAPSNVKAAGAVMIRFAGSEKTIIQKSNSATQFETSVEAAAQSPKVASAEKTLSAYFTSKCGPINTTPTT
jgi:phage tail sheath gpL-like